MYVLKQLSTTAFALVCAASLLFGMRVGRDQGLAQGRSDGAVVSSTTQAKIQTGLYRQGVIVGHAQQNAADNGWARAVWGCQRESQTLFGNGPMSCWSMLAFYKLGQESKAP